MAESKFSLLKTELIRKQRPWHGAVVNKSS
jgi:hypothetical protein